MDMGSNSLLMARRPVLPAATPAAVTPPSIPLSFQGNMPLSLTPPADTFQRQSFPNSSPVSVALRLKQDFHTLQGIERQRFWQGLSIAAQSVEPSSPANIARNRQNEMSIAAVSPEVARLVQQIQHFGPEGRVDFIKQLTGENSAYARYAETVLLQHQQPGPKMLQDLFKPQVQDWGNPTAISNAFGTMALGLITLPIVIPALTIAQPAALASIAGQVGMLFI